MSSSLEYLLNRYADKTCTPAEKEELLRLLQQSSNDEQVLQLIEKLLAERTPAHTMPEHSAQAVLLAIFEAGEAPVKPIETAKLRRIPLGRIVAAAVVVLLTASAGWLWLSRKSKTEVATTTNQNIQHDVAPGGNKALLTLSNGNTIVLDNAANGIVAQEGNAKVEKLKDGQLVYTADDKKSGNLFTIDHSPLTNTLSTPKGGEYNIVLPDGSKVWLNAASSITYPTAFTGDERTVSITGEAYFEVAPVMMKEKRGKKLSFIVKIINAATGGEAGRVEVLGTHFNINAYQDEGTVKTTLLEGKVKVVNGEWSMGNGQSATGNPKSAIRNRQSAILKPGEQAVMTLNSPLAVNHSPDLEVAMAWKNGVFHFENADIKTVMRQLSRWYDVEVVYKRNMIKDDPLFFEVPRNSKLSDVLKALEIAGGAGFRIGNKKIIVL